jgi:hypothetical protein
MPSTFGQQQLELLLQNRQIVLDRILQDALIDGKIGMHDLVAHAAHEVPRH